MTRKSIGVASVLTVLFLHPAWAAETPQPRQDPVLPRTEVAGKPVRFLSLAEALRCAHQQWTKNAPMYKLEQRADFERNINQMLLNVETAYWNLYGAYGNLYSRDEGLRQSHEAWKTVRTRFEAGKANAADVAQARGQYELFRSQRLSALDQMLDNERQLRGLAGMPPEDGKRLVPNTAPTLKEIKPEWAPALRWALAKRPEIRMSRQDLALAELNVWLAKNLSAMWCALVSGPANLHEAQLKRAQCALVVQDQELKTERFLGLEHRRVINLYEQIKAQRAQRDAFAQQLKIRHQEFGYGRGTLDQLLEAQRFWADSLSGEYQAIASYNNALCAFDFAQARSLKRCRDVLGGKALSSDSRPQKSPLLDVYLGFYR